MITLAFPQRIACAAATLFGRYGAGSADPSEVVDLPGPGPRAVGGVAGVGGPASGGVACGGGAAAAGVTAGEGSGPAALRGMVLVAAVVLSLAGVEGAAALAAVRVVLAGVWRASSSVEGINSVLRMQQARHRRLTQGLLDLKRLYWNCHEFRTGKRKCQSPYSRLGVPLPALSWWEILKLSPQELRQLLPPPPSGGQRPPPPLEPEKELSGQEGAE